MQYHALNGPVETLPDELADDGGVGMSWCVGECDWTGAEGAEGRVEGGLCHPSAFTLAQGRVEEVIQLKDVQGRDLGAQEDETGTVTRE